MKLYAGGYLAFYLPQGKNSIEIRLTLPTPLKTILANLQIPIAEIHLAALNGELVNVENVIVEDEDVVRVFSSVNGG